MKYQSSQIQRHKFEWLLPGAGERENESYLTCMELQFGMMERSGDGWWRCFHNSGNALNSFQTVHLQMVKMANFMLFIFCHDKKKKKKKNGWHKFWIVFLTCMVLVKNNKTKSEVNAEFESKLYKTRYSLAALVAEKLKLSFQLLQPVESYFLFFIKDLLSTKRHWARNWEYNVAVSMLIYSESKRSSATQTEYQMTQ